MVVVSVQFIFNTRVSLSSTGAARNRVNHTSLIAATSSLVGFPTPLVLGIATMLVGASSRWLVMPARVWVQVRSLPRQLCESLLIEVALSTRRQVPRVVRIVEVRIRPHQTFAKVNPATRRPTPLVS